MPPDEKGEDNDLAGERSAEGPVLLGISVLANGPGADDAADPGFFVGFPSGGFGWLQTSVIPRAPWQGFDWNAVSFVRSTKEILGRCIREKGLDLPPRAGQRWIACRLRSMSGRHPKGAAEGPLTH